MNTNFSVVPKVLTRNPGLAYKLGRSFVRQSLAGLVDRRFKVGTSSHLSLVTFRITPLCNLHCLMCNQRGTAGVLKGQYAAQEAKTVIPVEYYKRMVDEIGHLRPTFYIWGGEPFLYPGLMEFARYSIKNGPVWSVNTNGTFLKKYAEEIVRDQWHALFVSLDSFEEVNDKIRGKGSYRKVVEGFEEINRQKELQGSHLPYMGIVTTVSNMNYQYLDKLVEAVKDYKLAWHIINLGTYTNDEIIERHREFMVRTLDTEPDCLHGFNTGFNEGIDGDEFARILTRVHSIKTGYPIITVPVIRPSKIGTYYAQLDEPVRDHCTVPWYQANVDYNGDIYFCSDYPDYILGNLKEDRLLDAFNNERAARFRRNLKNTPDGIMPGCVRCYQNMLFGHRRPGF